jgi:hypothetical protein
MIIKYFTMQSFISQKVVCIFEVKIVTEEPNLKEIERKAYMSYHQDGLLDIFAGLYILAFGLGIYATIIWDYSFGLIMPGALIAIIIPIWIAAKRKITIPRIGYVNFGIRGSNKLTAIFIGMIVLGVGTLFTFTLVSSQGGSMQLRDLIFENGMLIVGLGTLVVCALFGYSTGLKRLYAYGLSATIALVIGHFMGVFFAYILFAVSIMVMVTGVAVLINFVKKYPLKGDRAIAD